MAGKARLKHNKWSLKCLFERGVDIVGSVVETSKWPYGNKRAGLGSIERV